MNCPHCSTQLDDGARFCGACGARLATGASPGGAPVDMDMMSTLVDGPPNQPPGMQQVGPVSSTVAIKPKSLAPQPLREVAPQAAAQVQAQAQAQMVARASGAAPMATPPAGQRQDPFIGRSLNNRYVIESKIGEGGFGAVYRGKQMGVGREVALKVLHPEMARDPNVLARFRREGSVACNLRDAHTITTYDFDQTPEGVLYIAMELLKGRSLHDIFHSEAPLGWQRVCHVIEQVCSSLAEAHAQGIVHRDIKPENIYLENRPGQIDFAKVLDFGIAKIVSGDMGSQQQSLQLTATGQTLGTLEYMSPEQLMGKQLDGRSDIYAVGVVGYELMTGRLPFPDAQGPAALIAAQLRKVPDPPSKARPDMNIPPGVDYLILKMLEKDRAKRFIDANDLRSAVIEVMNTGGQVPVRASGQQQRTSTPLPGQKVPSVPPRGPTPIPGDMQAPPPSVAPASQPPRGKAQGKPGPSTDQALEAATGSRLWLWVVLAGILVGGAVGAYIALGR